MTHAEHRVRSPPEPQSWPSLPRRWWPTGSRAWRSPARPCRNETARSFDSWALKRPPRLLRRGMPWHCKRFGRNRRCGCPSRVRSGRFGLAAVHCRSSPPNCATPCWCSQPRHWSGAPNGHRQREAFDTGAGSLSQARGNPGGCIRASRRVCSLANIRQSTGSRSRLARRPVAT